jgi:hypothetical protein
VADTDFLGRTPEQVQEDRERARQTAERIKNRDWPEVPKGHYAIPVTDWFACDGDEADDWEPPILGYRLFERKVARVYKSGRRVGRDAFISGRTMIATGVDSTRLLREIDLDRQVAVNLWGPGGDVKSTIDDIVCDVEGDDTFRATFGKLTGRCGCCGKALTDAKSKMVGLGPDCRGYR